MKKVGIQNAHIYDFIAMELGGPHGIHFLHKDLLNALSRARREREIRSNVTNRLAAFTLTDFEACIDYAMSKIRYNELLDNHITSHSW